MIPGCPLPDLGALLVSDMDRGAGSGAGLSPETASKNDVLSSGDGGPHSSESMVWSKVLQFMQIYEPLVWALQALALFIAFTVQGAMWSGAEENGGRGWTVALVWALGFTALLNGIHLLQKGLFSHL